LLLEIKDFAVQTQKMLPIGLSIREKLLLIMPFSFYSWIVPSKSSFSSN